MVRLHKLDLRHQISGNFHFSLLIYLFCLLILAACGQSGGGGGGAPGGGTTLPSACLKPQDLATAFQMANIEAQVSRSGHLNLLVKLENPTDFENLQHDLKSDQKAKVSKINSETLSLFILAESRAAETVDRYISENRIQSVEKDHETFRTEIQESEEGASLTSQKNSVSFSSDSDQFPNIGRETQGKEVIVAVIDTGVDYTHKDLAPYMWKNPKEVAANGIDDDGNGFIDDIYGWDFANQDNDPMADDTYSYHGTHVAGIVKQAALLSEQGINVKVMALKYLNANAAGLTSGAIQAIDYAVQNGALILNNSWGSASYSSALADAIERARAKNVLFVAASGNGDAQGKGVNIDQSPFYPAAYAINNVIAVAASDSKNQLAVWSNFGALNVDLSGPGVGITSTRNGNTYGTLSGTSMAAPYISGVAALIWSLRPELSYTEVRKILSSTVQKSSSLSGKVLTGGSIDRTKAVAIGKEYTHDPNDVGTSEASPSGAICEN